MNVGRVCRGESLIPRREGSRLFAAGTPDQFLVHLRNKIHKFANAMRRAALIGHRHLLNIRIQAVEETQRLWKTGKSHRKIGAA